jgi:membrane protease YdiL (CAAX protease family)
VKSLILRRPLLSYMALAYAFAWSIFLYVGMVAPGSPLFLASTFGPLFAALVVTGAAAGWRGVRELLGRATRWRVGLGWYAIVLLGPGLVVLLALGIGAVVSGVPLDLARLGSLPNGSPWYFVPVLFVLIFFVGGPLGEEFGWRGFALPKLLERRSALRASLILGVLWASWHLPLFWLPGSAQFRNVHETGVDIYAFWLGDFFISTTLLSVLFTWIYNSASQSMLFPLLFHTALNTWNGWLAPVQDPALNRTFQVATDVVLLCIVLVVVWSTGATRLSRVDARTSAVPSTQGFP